MYTHVYIYFFFAPGLLLNEEEKNCLNSLKGGYKGFFLPEGYTKSGATIRIGWEIQCLPYAGSFLLEMYATKETQDPWDAEKSRDMIGCTCLCSKSPWMQLLSIFGQDMQELFLLLTQIGIQEHLWKNPAYGRH